MVLIVDVIPDITHTEQFYIRAKNVCEYISKLPLSAEDNKNLKSLLVVYLKYAEKDAFLQGMEFQKNK